jgi:DNA-binding LacI/PurR family transcriptional regulator
MQALLALPQRPTAVVFANDLMATAGLSLALSRGVSVPGELSVTGFDDVEISAHLQPSLTSVHTDVVAWGRAAATRLLQLIHLEDPTPADLPDARLVVRASSGPVPR